MDRRTFLGSSGALITAGLAGCSTLAKDERQGVTIDRALLVNGTDDSHLFHLFIEHQDEIVHWSDHEVGDEGEQVEIEAPEEPGVKIHARVNEHRRTYAFDTEYRIRKYDGERVDLWIEFRPLLGEDTLVIIPKIKDSSDNDEG